MEFPSIQMINGEIFDGEKIGELTEFIINKFSEEGLSHDEAQIVLDKTKEIIGEFAIVCLRQPEELSKENESKEEIEKFVKNFINS